MVRNIFFPRLFVVQDEIALCERAALCILAGKPDRHAIF